ncbi:MAG TPA: LptF/LptG family permease [Fimbriiglobus sp.]|jgi:lipopolysaccharide export system permease protein|nr:LptF/LptG family permease [Fimbriiglobus sp.]
MTTLDRMFFAGYLRSYLIVLVSLLSLYVIVDLFTNLDDFSKGATFVENARHIGWYYATRVSQIFDRLSEAITLLGAMFTIAWMQRNNELLPQLSAGISTRRVLRPVLFGAILTLALGPLNQELVIPRIAEDLITDRDDPDGVKNTPVRGAYDPTGVHLEGQAAVRRDKMIRYLWVTFPEGGPSGMAHLTAKEAYYVPPDGGAQAGGWMLLYTTPDLSEGALPPNLERVGVGKYFLRTREVDFDSVTRGANWFLFASTPKMRELLAKPDARRQPAVATAFHMRLTRPLIGILLTVMGLSVILRDQNRHVFINAGLCLILCAVFYAAVYGCKYLGENDFVSPPLAAWLPVLVFGPLAVALVDAIHT